jgi:hypothetical protein
VRCPRGASSSWKQNIQPTNFHQLTIQHSFPLRSATITYIYLRGAVRKYNLFFSETVITLLMNNKYIVGTSFTKLGLFSHTHCPSLSTQFFHLCMRLCVPVAWSSLLKRRSASLTLCCCSMSSAKLRPRSAFFRGPKRCRSEGVKSGLHRGWGLD